MATRLQQVSTDIRTLLRSIASEYPTEHNMRAVWLADVERQVFHLSLILDKISPLATICDIGGGNSIFAPACAEIGIKTILVDHFEYLDEAKKLVINPSWSKAA